MSVPAVEGHTRISRFGAFNAFLVTEDDGLTLIDTATATAMRLLEPAALAPGHGPITIEPLGQMDDAIAKAS